MIARYVGTRHRWATGLKVKVVAVHRGEEILRKVSEIRPGDLVEFAPWIEEESRFSWVTSDAHPDELVIL